MNSLGPTFAALAASVAISSVSLRTSAADTVETWLVGATDVDFYLGMDGLGLPKEERTVFGDMMLGYGLVDRCSAYFGSTLEGTDAFSTGSTTHYFGVFGTPLESEHVDLDLFLDLSSGEKFEFRPAFELNVDADAAMRTWGLYLRAPLAISGRKFETGGPETTFHLDGTIGAYARVAPAHQLLLEYDMAYHPDPDAEERRTELGGVAAGYNVTLSDAMELINQVWVDIPQGDEKVSLGLMTGFIATLPSPGDTHP